MSRSVGNELPDELLAALRGDDPQANAGKGIAVASVDDKGFPHPAILSYTEMAAVDSRSIRMAIHGASKTAANMRRNGRMTIAIIEPDMVYYIKGVAQEIRPALESVPVMGMWNLAVEEVLEDTPTPYEQQMGAALTSGITFSTVRSAEYAAGGERILRELLSLP